MTTTLNVSLSQTLQSELGQQGVWAYAVYFDSDGNNPAWTELVINGTVQESGTVAIALPYPFVSGKVYFIIQSQASTQPNNLETLITTESGVNWSSANSYDFRYDSFEITLQNSPGDVANLTSVNGFGLPLGVSVEYSNGSNASVGYNIDGSTVVEQIQNINPAHTYTSNYSSGPLSGDFRMALSPTEAIAVSNPVFQPSDWAEYVQSLESPSTKEIVLSGLFNGAPDADGIWHNGGYFAYQLQVETTAQGSIFWLVPLSSSQIQGNIQLTVAELENSIYSTLGTANIFTEMDDSVPFLSAMNTGANNQWGKVLSEFLTGFTAGFYNTKGKSLNSQVATSIDLNRNMNWEPVYAFGQNLDSPPPSYQASDPYSQIFYANSNSYGSGYSDALMSQYAVGGPQVSVFDHGTNANVADIDLTIFADGDTPEDYTVPLVYNYVAPGTDGYRVPSPNTNGLNIALYLAAAVANNAGVVLDSTATITLNILSPDTDIWNTVTFDGASKAAGQYGLWQSWEITKQEGGYSAAPQNPQQQQPAGTILINSFPISEEANAIGWYQIQIGCKAFNLYTTTIDEQFANPNYAGQQGWLAIDGLATISPQTSQDQSVITFTVNFSVGDTVTIDPSLLIPNTVTANVDALSPPSCPVAGTISGGEFVALANQDDLVSNTITTTETEIAFAWTGENSSPNTVSWISGYTNKIDAETVALITITPASGSSLTTSATADIDGQWQTSPLTLQAGTYSVTMTQYPAGDTQFSNPSTPPSTILTLTVGA